MEDVLALYEEPIDPERVRLCFDERPCLMVSNVSEPLPMSDKHSKRLDYEYKRLEPAVILLAYNMDTGQRHLSLYSTKTKVDYATFLGEVITNHYADAKSIRLVQDNLGTHTKEVSTRCLVPRWQENSPRNWSSTLPQSTALG